jgi:hypothetical protein
MVTCAPVTSALAQAVHGCGASAETVVIMTDYRVGLTVGLSALFVEFAIDLALTGNLTHAFDQVAARRKDEQIDQEATENLFWD